MTREEHFEFNGDLLYKFTPLHQYGDGISKAELVMTKEAFIECYNRWIKGNGETKWKSFLRKIYYG